MLKAIIDCSSGLKEQIKVKEILIRGANIGFLNFETNIEQNRYYASALLQIGEYLRHTSIYVINADHHLSPLIFA